MLRICNIARDFFVFFIEILLTINSFGLRCWKNIYTTDKVVLEISRTLWCCGLIRHILDWKVEGSNLGTAKNLFQLKSTNIYSRKSEQKKTGTLSLFASVRAVVVGEEEETRREKDRSGGII